MYDLLLRVFLLTATLISPRMIENNFHHQIPFERFLRKCP